MRMNAAKTSGVAVQDVDAPVDVVLAQINDVEAYVGKVQNLASTKNYAKKTRGDGSLEIRSTYVLNIAMGYKLEYFILHTYVPKHRCVTWTLDYARHSDLHDSVGYWRADPHPDDPARTRLFYSSSSLVNGMPQFVMDLLTSHALKASTAWVKKHSELAAGGGGAKPRAAAPAAPAATPAAPPAVLSWRCAFALDNEDVTDPSVVDECRANGSSTAAAGAQPLPAGTGSATPRAASGAQSLPFSADSPNSWLTVLMISSMIVLYATSPYQQFLVVAC